MALLTDGRFSGATRGLMAGHVAPEAARGGPIAAVRDGDTSPSTSRRASCGSRSSDAEIAERHEDAGRPPKPRYETGVLAKYAKLVSSAVAGRGNGIDARLDRTAGSSH